MHGQFVAETRNRLTTAITASVEGRTRIRDQIRLASLIMVTGDPAKAAASPNPTRASPTWPTSTTVSALWSRPLHTIKQTFVMPHARSAAWSRRSSMPPTRNASL
jgi:hypothetical protein